MIANRYFVFEIKIQKENSNIAPIRRFCRRSNEAKNQLSFVFIHSPPDYAAMLCAR